MKEDNCVKLRAKRLPQNSDSMLYPRSGIRMLQNIIEYPPIGVADFRVEDINFDKIIHGLKKFTAKLPLEEKMSIESSWDNFRHKIESLPLRKNNLTKMKLSSLPKQESLTETDLDYVTDVDDETVLNGNVCPEEIEEGDIDRDIVIGTDVCLYTNSRKGRPWVGRVAEILPEKRFVIHWFSRSPRSKNIFIAMKNFDGSPYLTDQDLSSVMFWDMSENRNEDSFELSNYWLETIKAEYSNLDSSESY